MIACVLVPYFAAAVERRIDPSLTFKPLVIVRDTSGEAHRVWALSREAANTGIGPGMSLRQSQALCPQVTVLPASSSRYQDAFTELLDIFTDFSDRVEPEQSSHLATILYISLEKLRARAHLHLVQHMSQTVQKRTQLEVSLGLTTGKFPAYLAASSIGNNRYLFVTPGQEANFLAPFPIEYLPLDARLIRRFRLLGLDTLGQLAKLPVGAVLTQFGWEGGQLHKLARGEDDRPVLSYPPPPAEEIIRRLDGAVTNRLVLDALCQTIAAELALRLEAQGRMARVIGLMLELEDGRQWKTQRVLRQPANSAERLGLNLSLLLERVQITCGVEAVTVGLADLIPINARQLELFVKQSRLEYEQRLEQLLPSLIARYGSCFYDITLTNRLDRLPEQRFQVRARR